MSVMARRCRSQTCQLLLLQLLLLQLLLLLLLAKHQLLLVLLVLLKLLALGQGQVRHASRARCGCCCRSRRRRQHGWWLGGGWHWRRRAGRQVVKPLGRHGGDILALQDVVLLRRGGEEGPTVLVCEGDVLLTRVRLHADRYRS